MSTFLHGVGSVQFLDKSAELVDIKGLDITSLDKTGVINYEHRSDVPAQLVGKILKAKKIFKKEDCSDEHELYFWNKVKVPYLYIMAELLDDYCDSAKHVAGILRYDRDKKDQNEYAIAWFSVEGSEIPNSRSNKQIVSRGIARKVTLTASPCNQGCAVEILENQKPQIKDDFDEIFKSEANAIEMFKSGEGTNIYEAFLSKKEKSYCKIHKDKANLTKAIEAGSYNASPSTLVNGSAYQTEGLSSKQATTGAEDNTFQGSKKKDWKKRAKADYELWPHREKFEKFMQARLPHLAMGEIVALGRTLALKKSIDFEKALNSLIAKDKK